MYFAKEYVSLLGAGDYDECRRVRSAIHEHLEKWTQEKLITGGLIQIFLTPEEIEEEPMDEEPILRATGGLLPLVWTNVTYDWKSSVNERFGEFEETFRLVETGSIGEEFFK